MFQESCDVLNVGVRWAFVGKAPYTTDNVFDFLCSCIQSSIDMYNNKVGKKSAIKL